MNSKFLTPLLTLALILTPAPIVTAQGTNTSRMPSDWQAMQTLKPGKQILIEYKTNVGGSLECKFVGINGPRLTVSASGIQTTIEQADIQSIYRLKGKWSRGKMAKVGAGIGMLVGSFAGAARGVAIENAPGHINSEKDTFPAFAGFFIGTAAGAGLGALIGGRRKGNLLYQAR